ncbi:helix-turn-helix domain-containing protein [Tepidibacter hydrothermalis]|uniref:Helix-turn-helix domain-containing protein n=1 Tax=Tepidibacter hydrothermalis TaxID=3036126 RepID=A0ABY8EEB4_9FIRM|nr:helix-turn-helix domain-containing protein [Tepidibacter hydrothermalis]WFD11288.1 helix-turn-helix domain-containing protein [Tepidibacter hydrothermalis]
MGRKSHVLSEIKIKAVQDYLKGKKSVVKICDELSVGKTTVREWIKIYQSKGEFGLCPQTRNTSYSKELKIKAIEEYVAGNDSLLAISLKYGLRSKKQLQNWIMKYNSHEEIKSSGVGGNQIMTKGRTTTLKERISIVEYCIENDKNYNKTAKKYQVSYQQVPNWVIKFEESGIDGLLDRRGKCKPEDQLTEVEKLKAEMKLLKAKNKRLEIENELLKKLEEIEGGRT